MTAFLDRQARGERIAQVVTSQTVILSAAKDPFEAGKLSADVGFLLPEREGYRKIGVSHSFQDETTPASNRR
jgi:hypothetical protein